MRENDLYDVLESHEHDGDDDDDDEVDATPAGIESCQRPVPSLPQYSYEFPLFRHFKRELSCASNRVAAIACFELPDGPDSCRFRPLWIPAVEALDRCVRLAHYDEVNALLHDWGRFALQVEVEVPDLNRVWSRKSSWVPDVPLSVALSAVGWLVRAPCPPPSACLCLMRTPERAP